MHCGQEKQLKRHKRRLHVHRVIPPLNQLIIVGQNFPKSELIDNL